MECAYYHEPSLRSRVMHTLAQVSWSGSGISGSEKRPLMDAYQR